jgi:hypothetical protein
MSSRCIFAAVLALSVIACTDEKATDSGTRKDPCGPTQPCPAGRGVCLSGFCDGEPPGPCTVDSCGAGQMCYMGLKAICPSCANDTGCVLKPAGTNADAGDAAADGPDDSGDSLDGKTGSVEN